MWILCPLPLSQVQMRDINVEKYYVIQVPADESMEVCRKSRSSKDLQLGRINHIICAWQWLRLDILELKACKFGGLKELIEFLV